MTQAKATCIIGLLHLPSPLCRCHSLLVPLKLRSLTSSTRQYLTPRALLAALSDYDMWPIYLLGLTWLIPHTPATAYLTLILKSLSFSTLTTNLLTVPAYVMFALQLLFWTWVSERWNNRFLIILICQFYMLPLLVALEVLPGDTSYTWARYVLNTMLVGFPYVHAIFGEYQMHLSASVLAYANANRPSVPGPATDGRQPQWRAATLAPSALAPSRQPSTTCAFRHPASYPPT